MTYDHWKTTSPQDQGPFSIACESCGGPCGWLEGSDDEMPSGWFCISCEIFTEPDEKEAQA